MREKFNRSILGLKASRSKVRIYTVNPEFFFRDVILSLHALELEAKDYLND
jgi:hypothetical protein